MALQIDESEYEALVNRAKLAESAVPSQNLLNKLGAGKNRQRLLELIKEEYPQASIPELDAAKPVLSEVEKLRAEMKAERDARQKEKDEAAAREAESRSKDFVEKNRKKLRNDGWLPEGIEKVEKLMTDRGLTDYEAAAALVEKSEPKSDPVIPNYDRSWNFTQPDSPDQADDHKLLVSGVKGAKAWQDKQVAKFLKEKASGRLVL